MNKFRVGNGFDVHLLADGLPFVIGGITIEHTKGCVAHSDGDVAIHALCDALLGALALGDIGKHFPDTDKSYKGIDSKILLQKTYQMVCEKGWKLVNADITILLERPKVSPYIEKMQRAMEEVFISVEQKISNGTDDGSGDDVVKSDEDMPRIAIKATTTEKAGFVGREEGVAAYATVLLEKR